MTQLESTVYEVLLLFSCMFLYPLAWSLLEPSQEAYYTDASI